MENTNGFEKNWPKYREQLKQEHPHLTEDDLEYEPGKEEELLLRLQEKLNKTKREIRNWLSFLG